MDRFDPFVKYADVYGDIINWEKDPMNKPQNQNKYFFSDGKTYYEQICKMLRLMSVFKEAFNQIYSNEDEISEAWENFVNNLSASVVEGSEPDVTLTWTDDSVNFEFTMVPGVPGEQGVGITSISFNSDYTMTITLSDGNTYTSMSLKGETGPQGPQGETGSGLQILDVYATLADLQSAHPTGQPGDAYQVGSAGNYTLYIWSSSQSAWVPAGSLGTVSPSLSNPLMDGTASAGSQNLYSRGDHVHPTDTSRASKEELDELIKTSQALIDQSFTYRESPAIQDGLARIDKIKGNTLRWNQQVGTNVNGLNTTNGTTFTLNSNGSIHVTGTGTGNHFCEWRTVENPSFIMSKGHKYLVKFKGLTTGIVAQVGVYTTQTTYLVNKVNFIGDYSEIITPLQDGITASLVRFYTTDTFNGTTDIIMQLFDLTQMGLDSITDPAEFISLFPLPYYDYNSGTLLSFNGSGLKTIGKNALNKNDPILNAFINTATSAISEEAPLYRMATCRILPNTDYVVSKIAGKSFRIATLSSKPAFYAPYNMTMANHTGTSISFTSGPNDNYLAILFWSSANGDVLSIDEILNSLMVEIGTQHSSYEEYVENTIALPISINFPTGMKSAKNAYDELTETKATTRIGSIDLGSLTYTYDGECFIGRLPNDARELSANTETLNSITSMYQINNWSAVKFNKENMTLGTGVSRYICIFNTSYTDPTVFKTAMAGQYLYYELATPVETAVDLDMSFISYLDGTEQLLPVNGSVPSTSPIIADMTYLSIDDAMEYIIDKLANVPQNTQQILESLEDDVADLQTDTGNLQTAVSGLQTSVGNINTNIGQLSSTVAGHTASISDMQSDITDLNTGLSNLEDTVTDNTSRIGTLETGLSTTNGNVQNLETSVSDLDDTVTAQGTTVTAIDSIISDISNNPVVTALGSHELGFVAAYVEATLAANAGTRVTIPKPVIFPNNYTPLFIVGMSTGSSDVSICEIPPTFGSRDSVSCRVWNHGSQQTVQVTVYILCMRQRQSQ